MIKVTPAEFTLLVKYIHDISGIALDPGKEYLIETRLSPLLEQLGCKSYTELHQKAKTDPLKAIERKIIDGISTNETYFFRDKSPFDLLQFKLLPDIIDRRTDGGRKPRQVNLRIWSAASSTGQEIYSIAMIIKELGLDPKNYNITLIGTDISDAVIAQASYGKYNKFEATRGLSQGFLNKYFNQDGECWRIKDEVRAMAQFRKINLMESFAALGKFDIIFCRNVAIYFSPETRKNLYQKLCGALEPDGYLIIGSTESLSNDTTLFKPQKYLNSIFYQRSDYSPK
ncbi:CheR family methyltransferase [Desulforegula conservatrix]|uniref:CheR family methyltransferase n=1 Tax=Desulforegula conservatrix TaxID=153026 RepID=UPI0003FFAC0D|nr:CheR family methyltransferase [Desulforegula conservatrix]